MLSTCRSSSFSVRPCDRAGLACVIAQGAGSVAAAKVDLALGPVGLGSLFQGLAGSLATEPTDWADLPTLPPLPLEISGSLGNCLSSGVRAAGEAAAENPSVPPTRLGAALAGISRGLTCRGRIWVPHTSGFSRSGDHLGRIRRAGGGSLRLAASRPGSGSVSWPLWPFLRLLRLPSSCQTENGRGWWLAAGLRCCCA